MFLLFNFEQVNVSWVILNAMLLPVTCTDPRRSRLTLTIKINPNILVILLGLQIKISKFNNEKEEFVLPKLLFNESKVVVTRFTFAPKNETFSKSFISKLEMFTSCRVKFCIIWNTRKIKHSIIKMGYNISVGLFTKVPSSCVANYFKETIQNAYTRRKECNRAVDKNSECLKNLRKHFNHENN